MKKSEVISKLLDCGVIAVIRGNSTEEAVKLSKACAKGGIVGLEVTFTVPGAKEVIEALVKEKDSSYIVGAGTVLDATTARIAILAPNSWSPPTLTAMSVNSAIFIKSPIWPVSSPSMKSLKP